MQSLFRDLIVRFILHLPHSEIQCKNRIMYHIQKAYWFYLDFYSNENDKYLSFKHFSFIIGRYIGWKQKNIIKYYHNYMLYQKGILRCGVIMFSPDLKQVLLVQSYHGGRWSFPQGKIDINEYPVDCAKRETFEEINYSVSLTSASQSFSVYSEGYHSELFPVWGVHLDTKFSITTIKEIKKIAWKEVETLGEVLFPVYVELVKKLIYDHHLREKLPVSLHDH